MHRYHRLHMLCQTAISIVLASLLLIQSAHAVQSAPEKVIEQTVNNLLTEFSNQREELEKNHKKLFALVNSVAVPLFDVTRISRLVLSKNWKKATPQQKEDFSEGFTKLLVKTYATALFKYTGNEKIEFVRTDIKEKKGIELAAVKSKVNLGAVAPIPVDYSMIKKKDGNWKIYNLTVDGLNMVINYRKSYGSIIKEKGLDGLIQSLKKKST